MNKAEFIHTFRSYVGYHKSCGIDGYPADQLVRSGLQALSQQARGESCPEDVSKPGKPAGTEPAEAVSAQPEQKSQLSISELEAEILRCRNCSLHMQRQVSTAGSGGGRKPLKLMIVGDWLTVHDKASVTTGALFGSDQDQMCSRMVEAINLSGEDVFVTNVIKCSVPEMSQPNAEHIGRCSSYLHMQIELLRPQLICSMGIIASRLLTAQTRPLSQQRGRFFVYKTGSGSQIPVMPTYHPTFLLQNPEMKQATWADLQAIKQKLSG